MNIKRVIIILSSIFGIALVIIAAEIIGNFDSYYNVYISSDRFIEKYNNVKYSILEDNCISKKQMLKDFDIQFKTISDSLMLKERNAADYGFTFADNYEKYRQEVDSCTGEYEFYAVMHGILADVPSCHTQLLSPEYSRMDTNVFYGSYNYDFFEEPTENMLAAANIMNEKIDDFISEKTEMKTISFNYIDGNYELNRKGGTDYELPDGCCTIKLINGEKPQNFISDELFYSKLQYDEINECLFRSILLFNYTYGTECSLTLEYENGEQLEIKAYGGVRGEIAAIYAMSKRMTSDAATDLKDDPTVSYTISQNEFIGDKIYSYIDGDILYADLYSFDCSSDEIIAYKKFIDNCDFSSVIIDLRDNSGGVRRSFSNLIYPLFFSETISDTAVVYGVVNDETKLSGPSFYYHTPNDGISYKYEKVKADIYGKSRKMFRLTAEESYSGGAISDKDVYVLVSHDTASAADAAAYFMKTQTDAVLIGSNTGGEGYSSYVFKALPNSGLIMAYTPFIIDDEKRSLIGTSPDIFADNSLDGYRERIAMYLNGESCDLYSVRLKWDNVLVETLEMIEEGKSE